MNAEHLLDAIGQLDDELVRAAERYRRPKPRYGRLLGLAASFTVVIALGYMLTHFGMGGGAPSFSGGGNSAAPAGGSSAPSTPSGGSDNGWGGYSGAGIPSATDGADAPSETNAPEAAPSAGEGLTGDSQTGSSQTVLSGTVFARGGTYILSGEILAELPESGEPELLGQLLALYPDAPSPRTDTEAYVGLSLWAESGGTELLTAVYVELPAGGFARAELVEP